MYFTGLQLDVITMKMIDNETGPYLEIDLFMLWVDFNL